MVLLEEIKLVKMKPKYARALRDIWISPGVIEYTLQKKNLTVKNTLKKLINDEAKTIVALINKIPVGCARIHFLRGRKNHIVEMVIFVDPKQQSRGIGSKLMESVLKIIKKKKIKRLELEVNVDNKKAIGLYKKFKLKKEGIKRKVSQRGNKLIDNYTLARLF